MKFKSEDEKIKLIFPAKNKGKFRFKTRKNRSGFGESFRTRSSSFDENVYLEWQIGYDVPVNDVNKDKKSTSLKEISFRGSNGKEKYPYELSELLYEALKINLIGLDEVESLLKEIKSYDDLIEDTREIKIGDEVEEKEEINGMPFDETVTELPTFFMNETPDSTQIQVSIKGQQYAAGVQAMLYFNIPFHSFSNYEDLAGKSSEPGDNLIYEIDRSNVDVLFSLFEVFGMMSERHQEDVTKILDVLIELGNKNL